MAFAAAALDLLELEAAHEYRRERRENRRESREFQDPFDLTESDFRKLYRLRPDIVEELIDALEPRLAHRRISGISPKKQILAALRFYATGCYQRPVAEQWGISMSQPAISRAIHQVTDGINDLLFRQWVQFPMTNQARQLARDKFQLATHPFEGAIGVIDCSHVAIKAPKEHEEAYLNHRGYHSINVQMICDPNLQILNVNARFPGARHDAYIWNASAARRVMERSYNNGERNTYLIGDSGYPLEPWLLTPLPNEPVGTPRRAYHEAIMSTRNCVERMFGVLKGTWRCLNQHRTLQYDPGFAGRIVNACAVLHNMRNAQNAIENAQPPEQQLPVQQLRERQPEFEQNIRPLVIAQRIQERLIVDRFGR